MSYGIDLKVLSKSTEEMFARFEDFSFKPSPRSCLVEALLSDDAKRIAQVLAESHESLNLYDLLIGLYSISKSKTATLPAAALVTLIERIHTASGYSTKGFASTWELLSKQPTGKELANFLEKSFFTDDSVNNASLRTELYIKLATVLKPECSLTPEQLLPHLPPLFTSRLIEEEAIVSIVLAACYLVMRDKPDYSAIANSSEAATFLLHAILKNCDFESAKEKFDQFQQISDPKTWGKEACDFLANNPAFLDDKLCIALAAKDIRLAQGQMNKSSEIELRFIIDLVASHPTPEILNDLFSRCWRQNPVQLYPAAYYAHFIQNWQSLGGDPDQAIVKAIDTLLTGLSALAAEHKPLLGRIGEESRKDFVIGTLIDFKKATIEVIFSLAALATHKVAISNLFHSKLTSLRVTELNDEPMINCENHSFTFTHKITHTFTFK